MFLLLQSMATLWNWALGADILGTIFFFFIAWTDDYSHLVVLINIICFRFFFDLASHIGAKIALVLLFFQYNDFATKVNKNN